MSFRDELAKAIADRKFYEDEIALHTNQTTWVPRRNEFSEALKDDLGNPLMDASSTNVDDGLNPHRQGSLEQIRKNIARLQDFETGRSQAVNLAAEQSRRNIAQRLSGVNTDSNARGLLYSNYNQGRKSKERAGEAKELGTKVTDINNQFEQAYDQNQQGLITNQMDEYRQSVNDAQANYKKALRDYQTKGNTGAAIGSAVGTVAGALVPVV